jgi:hypothetical protein
LPKWRHLLRWEKTFCDPPAAESATYIMLDFVLLRKNARLTFFRGLFKKNRHIARHRFLRRSSTLSFAAIASSTSAWFSNRVLTVKLNREAGTFKSPTIKESWQLPRIKSSRPIVRSASAIKSSTTCPGTGVFLGKQVWYKEPLCPGFAGQHVCCDKKKIAMLRQDFAKKKRTHR